MLLQHLIETLRRNDDHPTVRVVVIPGLADADDRTIVECVARIVGAANVSLAPEQLSMLRAAA
ncbi:MAG: hypothetical protein ACI9WU_002277 [Myxococcota bacterium]|jgi:hypothetical protein